MNAESDTTGDPVKTPWHLWVVGVLALIWYVSGTYTTLMAQAGRLQGISPDEAFYYAAQPHWFMVVTDVALLAAVAGSGMLLMRSARAVRAFGLSLIAILVTHGYDIGMGTSRSFANQGALAVNLFILVLAVLMLFYANAMAKRGVLR